MKSALTALARVPESAILSLNAAMAAFVALAHGGALLLVLSGSIPTPPEFADTVRRIAPITLPLAGAVLLASGTAAIWRSSRLPLLKAQSAVLLASAIALLWWAGGILVSGSPAGSFSWTPGMLTGWVSYACLISARFLLPESRQAAGLYAPLLGVAVACPIDIGVFARLLLQ